MAFRFLAVLAMQFAVAVAGANAAETGAPVPVTRVGSSEKVCQLTGDTDWETGRSTAAGTLRNFGLDGVDLGYPVEHAGKLILLFGDSLPARHPAGPAGGFLLDDAVGAHRPPGTARQRRQMPGDASPPARRRQGVRSRHGDGCGPGHKASSTCLPAASASRVASMHSSSPTIARSPLRSSLPDAPLARPPASASCSENDDRSSIGRGVLARSDDDGRTFGGVVAMPAGFVYSVAVDALAAGRLPDDEQRLGIFIFGVPRYRAGVPYLAQAPVETFADPATWRFSSSVVAPTDS